MKDFAHRRHIIKSPKGVGLRSSIKKAGLFQRQSDDIRLHPWTFLISWPSNVANAISETEVVATWGQAATSRPIIVKSNKSLLLLTTLYWDESAERLLL